ncbi:MAG TPA: TIGR01244 family sulfur transferase [Tepidisphaeraceae bacterium]|jgi:uncharacterized protein (TIGR01244 family)|nr:TIGR01244 family sulfur transferase [Tepidisphaeraceae bacterium]
MPKLKLFILSLILTTIAGLSFFYFTRLPIPASLTQITADIYISPQLQATDIPRLRNRGIQTIVDFRPDGESADQPSHLQIQSASQTEGIEFHYLPIPHESIPDSAVDALANILSTSPKPLLLYCRTGRRAARTFSLAQASLPTGPDLQTILSQTAHVGFSATDLQANIITRIACRPLVPKS